MLKADAFGFRCMISINSCKVHNGLCDLLWTSTSVPRLFVKSSQSVFADDATQLTCATWSSDFLRFRSDSAAPAPATRLRLDASAFQLKLDGTTSKLTHDISTDLVCIAQLCACDCQSVAETGQFSHICSQNFPALCGAVFMFFKRRLSL